jgi:hypothetical protein
MQLSKASKRKHIHTRRIECLGYERDDGLWDIEGQITDTKTYSFENEDRGKVEIGEPVHNMLVRLTVDDNLIIQKAEAITTFSPFNICPKISNTVETLRGLKISSGFTKSVKERIGGTSGCTHITQLITGPLATTAYQTITPLLFARKKKRRGLGKPSIIDTCYGWAANGPIVKRIWPKYFNKTQK